MTWGESFGAGFWDAITFNQESGSSFSFTPQVSRAVPASTFGISKASSVAVAIAEASGLKTRVAGGDIIIDPETPRPNERPPQFVRVFWSPNAPQMISSIRSLHAQGRTVRIVSTESINANQRAQGSLIPAGSVASAANPDAGKGSLWDWWSAQVARGVNSVFGAGTASIPPSQYRPDEAPSTLGTRSALDFNAQGVKARLEPGVVFVPRKGEETEENMRLTLRNIQNVQRQNPQAPIILKESVDMVKLMAAADARLAGADAQSKTFIDNIESAISNASGLDTLKRGIGGIKDAGTGFFDRLQKGADTASTTIKWGSIAVVALVVGVLVVGAAVYFRPASR